MLSEVSVTARLSSNAERQNQIKTHTTIRAAVSLKPAVYGVVLTKVYYRRGSKGKPALMPCQETFQGNLSCVSHETVHDLVRAVLFVSSPGQSHAQHHIKFHHQDLQFTPERCIFGIVWKTYNLHQKLLLLVCVFCCAQK